MINHFYFNSYLGTYYCQMCQKKIKRNMIFHSIGNNHEFKSIYICMKCVNTKVEALKIGEILLSLKML